MSRLRDRIVRVSGALFLAALLLVPLVESGHSHDNRALARPCAVCVAAHHSPAATAPIVAVSAPVARASATVFSPIRALAWRDHSPRRGRAPPHPVFVEGV